MQRERLRAAVVVVLGLLAVSATAATLQGQSGVSVGEGGTTEGGSGSGAGSGDGIGTGTAVDVPAVGVPDITPPAGWLEWGISIVFGLGALLYLGVLLYEYYVDGWDGVKRVTRQFRDVILAATLAAVVWFLNLLLLYLSGGEEGAAPTPPDEPGGTGETSTEVVTETATGIPPVVMILASLIGVVVLVVAFWYFMDSRDGDGSDVADVSADEPDVDIGGSDATPEVDSPFEDVPAENVVYRAWRQLADAVDGVDRAAHTPGEVARRAIDAGYDSGAVSTLTRTFEEVRYGRLEPDEDRASRVQSALDSIDVDASEPDGGRDGS